MSLLLRRIFPFLLPCLLAGCLARPATLPAVPTPRLSGGAGLYEQHCAACHGALDRTLLVGRSASRIRSSFVQFPVMARLNALSDADLALISATLQPRS